MRFQCSFVPRERCCCAYDFAGSARTATAASPSDSQPHKHESVAAHRPRAFSALKDPGKRARPLNPLRRLTSWIAGTVRPSRRTRMRGSIFGRQSRMLMELGAYPQVAEHSLGILVEDLFQHLRLVALGVPVLQ